MRKISLIILFVPIKSLAQDIIISNDTAINNTWTITPSTRTLKIINGAKISGSGTIVGGVLDINPFAWAFDTTLTVNPYGTFNGEFSMSWYGAAGGVSDNTKFIQKAIDVVLNSSMPHVIKCQRGVYHCSTPLLIARQLAGVYQQVTIHIYGETSFWDSTSPTQWIYDGVDSFFVGFQKNKGSEFDHIRLGGKYIPPSSSNQMTYYALTDVTYVDAGGICSNNLTGLAIDPYFNNSGSTGIQTHDIIVTGFARLIDVCPRGGSNGDILYFDKIQFGEGKIGFRGNQPQEKGNVLTRINCWGHLFTLYQDYTGAGNYSIDWANIAGSVINLFRIDQSGFFSSNISHIYAENIGYIGNLATGGLPMSFKSCTFEFINQNLAGDRYINFTNSPMIDFTDCTFRYYGYPAQVLKFLGASAMYINCTFSGPTTGIPNQNIINYPIPPVGNVRVQAKNNVPN